MTCQCPKSFDCFCEPGVMHTFSEGCNWHTNSCVLGNSPQSRGKGGMKAGSNNHKEKFKVWQIVKSKSVQPTHLQPVENPCFELKCYSCGTLHQWYCDGVDTTNSLKGVYHYMSVQPDEVAFHLETCRFYPDQTVVNIFRFDNYFARCRNMRCKRIMVVDYVKVYSNKETGCFCERHWQDADEGVPPKMGEVVSAYYPHFLDKLDLMTRKKHILLDPCSYYVCGACDPILDIRTGRMRQISMPRMNDDDKAPTCLQRHVTSLAHPMARPDADQCNRCSCIKRRIGGDPCANFETIDGKQYPMFCEDVLRLDSLQRGIIIYYDDNDEEEQVFAGCQVLHCRRCAMQKSSRRRDTGRLYCYACLFIHNVEEHWTYRKFVSNMTAYNKRKKEMAQEEAASKKRIRLESSESKEAAPDVT